MEKGINMNNNETIVIASFGDQASADAAIDHLREWDKRVREVKLGVIGRVYTVDGVVQAEVVHGGIFNRSMPISDAAVRVLAQELDSHTGVIVACDDYEASMVTDALSRSGGLILVNTLERTAEEIAEENKNVEAALKEQAIEDNSNKAKLSPVRNITPPV